MVDPHEVRRSYDALVDVFDARRPETDGAVEAVAEALDALDGPRRVLDAGCGSGRPVLSLLADAGVEAVGLDCAGEQLRRARANAPGAALAQGDLARLPVATATVDAVVALWSVVHVPLDRHATAVEEFARVLDAGGRLLLVEGAEPWRGENPDWLDAGVAMQWDVAGAERTRRQLRAAGFAVREERAIPDPLDDGESAGPHPWRLFDAELDG